MSGELVASLVLKLNDHGSAAATRALQAVTRATKETGEAAKSASAAAMSAFKRMADAREVLGIRSEKAIQNEIRQTEAAYQRLAESGKAGARELSRAQDAVREKVGKLRQELDGVKSSAGGAGNALTKAMSVVGGLAAGRAILAGPISRTMNYSMELAHTSNTLYATKSVAERIAAKNEINAAVMRGVRGNGGTREESLATLKTLAASGEYGNDPKAAYAMLPGVMRAAAATGTDPTLMANIAIKAKQSMGLTNTDRVFGMAAKGGIEGQFELRDMAKWLPDQMGSAASAGLRGEKGFATIVAMNQMAMRTAGTTDAAGNNVKNLLAKVNATDTAADAKKMGIDLSGSLAAAQAKGVGGVDAFLNLIEQQMAKDPRLVKLRGQAKNATGAELKENLNAQIGILEGSAIGKWLQDRQALSAAVPLLSDRARFNEITGNTFGEKDTIGALHPVVAAEAAFQAQQAAAESANAMQTALNGVNPLLGSMASGLGKMMEQHPALAAALAGTTLAVGTLGAVAATAAVSIGLLGGKGVAGAAGGMIPAGAGGALGTAAKWAGGLGLAGYAGYEVGGWANGKINSFVESESLGKNDSLGSLLYDILHGEKEPVKVDVAVKVENGNIVAEVNKANAREAGRH